MIWEQEYCPDIAVMQDTELDNLSKSIYLPYPLRSYQWEGVRFLLKSDSALLADQMGLGKTVQVAVALSLLLPKYKLGRTLIIVPASLRTNWKRELDSWAKNLSVRALTVKGVGKLYQRGGVKPSLWGR